MKTSHRLMTLKTWKLTSAKFSENMFSGENFLLGCGNNEVVASHIEYKREARLVISREVRQGSSSSDVG